MQEIAEGIVISSEFRRITVGAIATGSGVICVDVPPFPADARRWHSELLEHFKQPIYAVVLTDAQRDRLLGLHWFDEAIIVAHDAAMAAMRLLPPGFVDQSADLLATNSDERISFMGVRLHYPRVTFSARLLLHNGGAAIPLLAMPGPTPGNVWIHLPEQRVVFTGDSVVVGMPPYMARPQSKAWLDSLTLLRRPRFAADVIVPGRGPLTTKEATRPLSEFLRYVRRRVQNFYRARRLRAELPALLPEVLALLEIPPGEEDEVERRIRAGLESIYDELLAEERQDRSPASLLPPPPLD